MRPSKPALPPRLRLLRRRSMQLLIAAEKAVDKAEGAQQLRNVR